MKGETHLDKIEKNEIVEENLGLVHKVLQDIYKNAYTGILSYEDLFQEGICGLILAANKFDPNIGNEFSTYAWWWVRHYILRAIQKQAHSVRLPINLQEKWKRLAKTAELRNFSKEKMIIQFSSKYHFDPGIMLAEKSLDYLLMTEDGFVPLIELLPNSFDTYQECLKEISSKREKILYSILQSILSKKQLEILCLKIGLGYYPHTLEEIGKKYNVTMQCIFNIIKLQIFPKLRASKSFNIFIQQTLFE